MHWGCGTGTCAFGMAETGCAVVGVEESEAMLAKARSKRTSSRRVKWVLSALPHLSWAPVALDAGLMHVTLQFVGDPEAALNEAMRIIKAEGRVVWGLIYGPWTHHYRTRAQVDPTSVYHGGHSWTLSELTLVMRREPSQVCGDPYGGPRGISHRGPGVRVGIPLSCRPFLGRCRFLYDKGPIAAGEPNTPS